MRKNARIRRGEYHGFVRTRYVPVNSSTRIPWYISSIIPGNHGKCLHCAGIFYILHDGTSKSVFARKQQFGREQELKNCVIRPFWMGTGIIIPGILHGTMGFSRFAVCTIFRLYEVQAICVTINT